MFANCAKMLTRDLKVVESQDKAYKVYFHELRNFAQQTFFVKLFFCMYNFIFGICRSQSLDKLQLGVAGMPRCTT